MNNANGTINPIEFEYRCNSLSKRIEALDEILSEFEINIEKTMTSINEVV